MMGELQCDPANFTRRIISREKKMKKYVKKMQEKVKNTIKDLFAVIGLSWDLVSEKKWYATYICKPNGSED